MSPKIKFNDQYFLSWLTSYTDLDSLRAEAKKIFKGVNQQNMFKKAHAILAFFDKIVALVERCAIDFSNLEGVDEPSGKKKLDIAVKFLDKVVELPFYLELFDEKLLRFLISWAVESLNKHIGDSWQESVVL